MIKQLFILKATGTCIVHINFNQIEYGKEKSKNVDPQLVSGFFSAILAFSETIVEGADNAINYMQLKNRLFYFYKINAFYIILECSADDKTLINEDYESILIDIGLLFEDTFLREQKSEDIFFSIEDENFVKDVNSIISSQIRKRFSKKLLNN